MACLEAARAVGANDWYLAAGFVRNLIWDHLHAKPTPTPLSDVDFVYFDLDDTSMEAEDRLKSNLERLLPGALWEVRNQARMHIRNSHRAYHDTEDAMAHWPEIPTCVGVRIKESGEIIVVAPFGLDESWSLEVRPNPKTSYPPELFTQRVKDKKWTDFWPNLRIHWPNGVDTDNL
jgi:hypothetical protein